MPTATATVTMRFAVAGGPPLPAELKVDQDVEYVRSERATKPDPAWELTDAAGHWHAFATTDDDLQDHLPTLVSTPVRIPCDGSCGGMCGGEGYTVIRYNCRACGEEVAPRFIPDEVARTIGTPVFGLKQWTLRLSDWPGEVPSTGQWVSVRGTVGGREVFGLGVVDGADVVKEVGEAMAVSVTIVGATALANRL